MKLQMKSSIKTFFIVAIVATTFLNCNQTENQSTPSSQAPVMPRLESMTIPSFESSSTSGSLKKSSTENVSSLNHGLASAYVGFWTLYTGVALAVPVFAYSELLHQMPTPTVEGWQWKKSAGNFSATLTAIAVNNQVQWSMKLSNDTIKDFVWFTGTSSVDGKIGSWKFLDKDQTPHYSFTYAFTTDSAAAKVLGDVRTEVVAKSDTAYGNYLAWTLGDKLNSFIAYGEKEKESVTIQVSGAKGAGKASLARAINNYCWDGKANAYQDIQCDVLVLP